MGFCSGMSKTVLFIFNFLFALAGLALLIVGVLSKINADSTHHADVVPAAIKTIPILVIIVGVVVFVISFFGCCGAVRESTCMLTTYAVILLVIFLLQVAVAVYAFMQIRNEEGLHTEIQSVAERIFSQFNKDPVSTESVNSIQREGECCGVHGPAEMQFPNRTYPISCCAGEVVTCSAPFQNGCLQTMIDFAMSVAKVIGIVAISLSVTEIVGAIFALCLSSSIRNQYRRGAYA